MLLGLLLGILLAFALDVRRQVAVRYKINKTPERKEQMVTIRVFLILLSLLLGFTLTSAASRFAECRSLAGRNSFDRSDLFSRQHPAQLYRDRSQQPLWEYVDARLAIDDADSSLFDEAMSRFKRIQDELWLDGAIVAQNDRSVITAAYVNCLSQTVELDAKRFAAFECHVAPPIWILIIFVFVSLFVSFTRGATMTSRIWLSLILIPITVAIVVALIADLDTATHGLIRLDQCSIKRLKAEIGTELAH